jgi:Mycothiol maleylpyruvate isomerase N-terminal domain
MGRRGRAAKGMRQAQAAVASGPVHLARWAALTRRPNANARMHTNPHRRIVALDAQAVSESVRLVAQATAADLARPTPCADWTLHGLLRHMATQHYTFATASAGDGDLGRWRLRPLGDNPVAAHRAAAECVLAAFAADDVLDREFPCRS